VVVVVDPQVTSLTWVVVVSELTKYFSDIVTNPKSGETIRAVIKITI
jgi:hypothetical protein